MDGKHSIWIGSMMIDSWHQRRYVEYLVWVARSMIILTWSTDSLPYEILLATGTIHFVIFWSRPRLTICSSYQLDKILYTMLRITSDTNPDIQAITSEFSKSRFFCKEAFDHRGVTCDDYSGIVIGWIWAKVVWALTWDLIPMRSQLKIWFIEVVELYRRQNIGQSLILHAEKINQWKYYSSNASLDDVSNEASKRMFLNTWYTPIDPYHLQKIVGK